MTTLRKIPSTLKKGDVVAVRATVKYDFETDDGRVYVDLDGAYASGVALPPEKLLGLVHPHLVVGDRVRCGNVAGTIMGIAGGWAWIQIAPDQFISAALGLVDRDDDTSSLPATPPSDAEALPAEAAE